MIHPSRQQTGSASLKKWTPHRSAPTTPVAAPPEVHEDSNKGPHPQGRKQLGGRLSNVTKANARAAIRDVLDMITMAMASIFGPALMNITNLLPGATLRYPEFAQSVSGYAIHCFTGY